jgi:hypothetical protein
MAASAKAWRVISGAAAAAGVAYQRQQQAAGSSNGVSDISAGENGAGNISSKNRK